MSTLEYLIRNYGYSAILVGTFLEGETVLVLAGLAAHLGYLKLPWVIVAAFVGALSGDLLYFSLGRWRGQRMLPRHPQWQDRIDKFQKVLARYHSPLIIMFRFLYGVRTLAPFALGMSQVPSGKFILLDGVSVLVWAMAVGIGGYLFGNVLEVMIGDIKRYELAVMGMIAVVGVLIGAILFYRRKDKIAEG